MLRCSRRSASAKFPVCVCVLVQHLDVGAVGDPLGQLLRGEADPLQVEGVGPLGLPLGWEVHEGGGAVHVQLRVEGGTRKITFKMKIKMKMKRERKIKGTGEEAEEAGIEDGWMNGCMDGWMEDQGVR